MVRETVTGRAPYTVDVLLPGMLHAKLFRSSVPHAKIRRLDASRARLLTGVAAVLTASDVPRKRFGFTVQDEELFAGEKARYIGDVIAAVVAKDEETAEAALSLIDCDYEELPAALSPDQALKRKCPVNSRKLRLLPAERRAGAQLASGGGNQHRASSSLLQG